MSLIVGVTFINSRIGFPGNDEQLKFPKSAERVTYKRLYNRPFNIVATIWKDSKTLQFIRILRKTIIIEVYRSRSQGILLIPE